MASLKGDWVTNIPKGGVRAQYPRRLAKYVEGEPMETPDTLPYSQLVDGGIRGMYLDEDIPEGLKSRPIVTFNDQPIP